MKKMNIVIAPALLAIAFGASAADNCTIKIKGDDRMQFDIKEATVSASCAKINIELEHTGKLPVTAMGHNVVISKNSDMAGVAKDAIAAGAANGYLPAGDARVIASTRLIGGGEKAQASFAGKKLSAGEQYNFFCSFPGHSTMMKGKLIVVP